MSKGVTIKEIAEIAGVSVATVSYVLNGKKKVSEKTKTRILSIMKELQYTPNVSAQNLRTADSKLVFALINNYSPFNTEILAALELEFKKYDYQMLTLTGHFPEVIRTNIFDGGIVLNYNLTSEELTNLTENIRKKTVMLSGNALPTTCVVSMDNNQGMQLILEEMKKSFHQNLCFIQGTETSLNNRERYQSAKKYYQEFFGKNDFDIRVYSARFKTEPAYKLALQLLEAKLYNAFVCFNDSMALGVYQAAAELGLVVGKDISISGYDNIFFGQHLSPPLTTINIDKTLWAQEIVKKYFSLNQRETEPQPITKIPVSLIKNKSIRYA